MDMRYLTAGESHGPALTAIIEGLPAGLPLAADYVNEQLKRRQGGYGRGGRMKIESDRVRFVAGVRGGFTLGSPVAMQIENKDWVNWQEVMDPGEGARLEEKAVTRPRPGHADLAGALKYGHRDVRNVLERASARETAARVAVGAVARRFLEELGVEIIGHVVRIGPAAAKTPADLLNASGELLTADGPGSGQQGEEKAAVFQGGGREENVLAGSAGRFGPWEEFRKYAATVLPRLRETAARSPVFCLDPAAEKAMMETIDEAREKGDTLGGVFEVRVYGLPPGLGSYVHWDRRLDGRLARALMSIPAIKGVEIGLGLAGAGLSGSETHDEIFFAPGFGFYRRTNRAGGLEGGVTNGEPLILRAAMKPIPTLARPLASVDLLTRRPVRATVERSDTCAVPAACVIGEAVVAWELAAACREKFGGDSLAEIRRAMENYLFSGRGGPQCE
ncbi:MAG: chorismate synthase [Bacillota bacterium]